MLKKKLAKKAINTASEKTLNLNETNNNKINIKTSHLFTTSLWQNVYHWEVKLNEKLKELSPGTHISHIYNPIEYAAQVHCDYLRRYLKGTKKLLFIGMNPGPDGMGQTGISLKMANENDLWMQFFQLEQELNENLANLTPSPEVTHIYNPIEYANDVHCKYLQKYLNSKKSVFIIGMNPGPNGMMQTGVPFGNITTVKVYMDLNGTVEQPPTVHPKRPILGLDITRDEPSGKRLWTLFQQLSNGSLETFFKQCFVHNFCPLSFFDRTGKNITPSELKGPYKAFIRDECLYTTEKILQLIQPEIIVAVGSYVHDCLKKSEYCKNKRLLRLDHPSPRSVNNTNWPEKAEKFLKDERLIEYFRNEVPTN